MQPGQATGTPPRTTWSAHTFSSLRHPAYRAYFAGQFFSLIGTWMQMAAQSWLVYDLTGSKAMLGLVSLVGSIPTLLLSTWGGILADRYPRRTILLVCQVLLALQAIALALLVLTEGIHIAHLMILAAVYVGWQRLREIDPASVQAGSRGIGRALLGTSLVLLVAACLLWSGRTAARRSRSRRSRATPRCSRAGGSAGSSCGSTAGRASCSRSRRRRRHHAPTTPIPARAAALGGSASRSS